jgi:hypothetical protein
MVLIKILLIFLYAFHDYGEKSGSGNSYEFNEGACMHEGHSASRNGFTVYKTGKPESADYRCDGSREKGQAIFLP